MNAGRLENVYDHMSGSQKFEIAWMLSEEARVVKIAEIRETNPEYSEDQIMIEYIRKTHGIDLTVWWSNRV